MDSGQLQDLIQADLDGELSVAERAELARLLLQDPEARQLQSEFRKTDQLLRDVAEAEPPSGLRAAILAGPVQSPSMGNSGRSQSNWPVYRIAAGILGGLLIVGLSYYLIDANVPRKDLQGSLGTAGGPEMTVRMTPQDHLSMRADSVEVNASLRRNGQALRLELNSSATIPSELIARIDPAKTTFVGIPGDAHLTTASDQVTVQLATGSQFVVLDFSGAAPIRLELRSGGQLLGEGSLSIGDR